MGLLQRNKSYFLYSNKGSRKLNIHILNTRVFEQELKHSISNVHMEIESAVVVERPVVQDSICIQ